MRKFMLFAMLLVAVTITAGCATATTGKKLADVARPAPASYAEALKACVGDDPSQEMINACTTAVQADADRAASTAASAAEAAKKRAVVIPTGYYGGYGYSTYPYYGGSTGRVRTGRRVRTY